MSSEYQSHIEVKCESEKSFGILFAIIFLLIGFYPVIDAEGIRLWALVVAFFFVILALWAPVNL